MTQIDFNKKFSTVDEHFLGTNENIITLNDNIEVNQKELIELHNKYNKWNENKLTNISTEASTNAERVERQLLENKQFVIDRLKKHEEQITSIKAILYIICGLVLAGVIATILILR